MIYMSTQVTVVSVASPTSNASQKSVALPVNVALGQQLLVQQPTPVSPVKVATSQTTTQVRWTHYWSRWLLEGGVLPMQKRSHNCMGLTVLTWIWSFSLSFGFNGLPLTFKHFQNIKPVQSVSVGGVSGSQFKTIIPIASQPNVQQIQVPGSRFHYVRLVTATTASSTGQPSVPSTSTIPTGDIITHHSKCCVTLSVWVPNCPG